MRIGLVLAFLISAACNTSDGEPASDAMGGGGEVGSGGSTSPSAPKILTLSTNIKTVHEVDMLTISAIVTDPDGIGDVIGGQLMTDDGASAYGAFATDAGEGAYSMSLSWNAIDTIEAIETMSGAPASRTFRATFFDAAGHSAYREVTVSLECRDGHAACDGTCGGVKYTMAQCGDCGHACPTVPSNEAFCAEDDGGTCALQRDLTQRISCAQQCKSPYPTCDAGYAYYGSSAIELPCNQVPPATYNNAAFASMACICLE